ncbi:hypothetical protein R6258_05740 [Halomonas sp. HP20-15]|uniref:hypothetical protein n=1 Tax=Halomonas sp. HP20-15 TaxID=3085901 RepID=UPI002982168A|nr:hypothetical protein [Halomonas sp. HP20-15]MDW5376417.1 hypothetical protein [Halomonas sp. HP20-15]
MITPFEKPYKNRPYSAIEFSGLERLLGVGPMCQHTVIVDNEYIALTDQEQTLHGSD